MLMVDFGCRLLNLQQMQFEELWSLLRHANLVEVCVWIVLTGK